MAMPQTCKPIRPTLSAFSNCLFGFLGRKCNFMKHFFLSLLGLFLFVGTANAQFKLTSSGFVSTEDEAKNYTVIEVPNTSKNELFKRAKMYLNGLYNNPKFVTSEVDNEQIVIDALDAEELRIIFVMNGPNLWQYSYKYTFEFKDNKVRFIPVFKCLANIQNNDEIGLIGVNVMGNCSGIFNKKGKCLKDKAKEAVETSTNDYFAAFVNAIKNNTQQPTEDW